MVQKNLNIEKIALEVVQMKFLAMHITNHKLSFDIFMVGITNDKLSSLLFNIEFNELLVHNEDPKHLKRFWIAINQVWFASFGQKWQKSICFHFPS